MFFDIQEVAEPCSGWAQTNRPIRPGQAAPDTRGSTNEGDEPRTQSHHAMRVAASRADMDLHFLDTHGSA